MVGSQGKALLHIGQKMELHQSPQLRQQLKLKVPVFWYKHTSYHTSKICSEKISTMLGKSIPAAQQAITGPSETSIDQPQAKWGGKMTGKFVIVYLIYIYIYIYNIFKTPILRRQKKYSLGAVGNRRSCNQWQGTSWTICHRACKFRQHHSNGSWATYCHGCACIVAVHPA